MRRLCSFLLAHFALCILCFLCTQKPLFLICNWGYRDIPVTFRDIVDIYTHGLTIDAATAAYMTIVPILMAWVYALRPCFNIKAWMKAYDALMAIVIALAAVADASLYSFWGFKLDKVVFQFIDDPKNAFASVSTGYLVVRLLLLVFLVVVIWYVLCLATRLLKKVRKRKPSFLKAVAVSAAMLLLFVGDFVVIRGLKTRPKTPATAYYSSTYYFNHAALNPLYNLFYTSFKKDDFGNQFRYMSDEERREAISGLFPMSSGSSVVASDSSMAAVKDSSEIIVKTQRPNVLLIVMEGMGARFLESLGGGRPVAKNINDIMQHQSYWFSSAYAGSFQTDRGVICAMSGFPGLPTVSIMLYTRKVRSLPGLAKSLKAEGYETQMLYGGDMTYLNFADYFLATGYDKLLSENAFTKEERSAKWGVPDHITFQWLYDDIQKREQTGKPWFTGFLTLSSHHPFDVPYHEYDIPLENGFAYTDSCFGDFIHRLEQTPAWDNLLIACVADHGYNYSVLEDPEFPHIPMFFTGGAVSRLGRDDRLVCQTDLPATILGQLGIAHEDFIYSRDVFSRTYRHPSALLTYPNGFQYRDTTGVTVYDILTDKVVSGRDPQREHTAKAILQTLYDDIDKR